MMSWLADLFSEPTFLRFPMVVVFVAGALLGHFTLTVRCHNLWYGLPLHPTLTDVGQLTFGLIFVAGPVIFWVAGPDLLTPLLAGTDCVWQQRIAWYAALCCPVGLLILPAVTYARHRYRSPALASNHTEKLDIAERLGRRPEGDGKYRRLTRLPGNEVFKINLVERTLLLPNLPEAWDGLTILHLTDVHFCGTPDREYFEHVFDLCGQREPDLIAFTGDLVDSEHHHTWIAPLFQRLRSREGAFGILGNHDRWYQGDVIAEALTDADVHVVTNRWETRQVRGHPLVIIGHEGPWVLPAPDLTDCPPDAFRLCLSHTPDNIRWAKAQQIDLVLAGHVHGGQIRFPLIGSLLVPSRYGRRYDWGVFAEGDTVMHVSCGVSGKHPLRYGCRPEAVWLVLRQARS